MKAIVIYKSKSGYTKTYAEWISQELQCPLREVGEVSVSELMEYDTIIYGGGLYACGINGKTFLKKNFAQLKEKNLIVWATGCSPGHPEELEEVWNFNFTKEELKHIKTFYLRGGFDYKKLHTGDKILMNMLKIRLKHKEDRTADEEGLLKAYDIPEYHCKKENIVALVEYVRAL